MWSIIGHERVMSYLRRSLEKDALSHAYLFTGPRQVGKMTAALLLAQAVNCLGSDAPCGECSSCLRISARNHPDVQVLRLLTADEAEDKKAKSELVVDQIRALQHWASLPPYEGRTRVFIFEQAELLNEAAANSLLKTLEEPLPKVLLILLAPSPGAVPETIVSRCQRLVFGRVPAEEIEELLLSRGLSPDKASLLSRLADGAPGWALAALEQEESLIQRAERLERLLGLIRQGYEERFEAAEELSGKGAQGRSEVAEVICGWQGLWRDLLLSRLGCSEGILNFDYQEKIVAVSRLLELAHIRTFVDTITEARGWVERNVSPRLAMEALMLDMPLVDKVRVKG
ncbi:MAG: DNA polymerase III subunit delta' [Dehalococcoidia bacterium]|nr:DNA polymerase III subunit delta' [Dehalococcoidia bacterium]